MLWRIRASFHQSWVALCDTEKDPMSRKTLIKALYHSKKKNSRTLSANEAQNRKPNLTSQIRQVLVNLRVVWWPLVPSQVEFPRS